MCTGLLPREPAVTDAQQRPPTNVRIIVRQGFVVGVSNPKGFLIFSAVLPQFVNRSAGHVTPQLLLLDIVCAAVALVSDSAWGLLADGTWLVPWVAPPPVRDWCSVRDGDGRPRCPSGSHRE